MSELSLHLILYAISSVVIPLAVMLSVALLRGRISRRLCSLMLLLCCVRILIPTGWVHGIVNIGNGRLSGREVIILESGDSLTVEETDVIKEAASVPELGGIVVPDGLNRNTDSDPAVSIFVIWVTVAILLMLTRLTLEVALTSRERRVKAVPPEELLRIYRKVAAAMELKSPPELLTVSGDVFPHLCGIFRKTIVIGERHARDEGIVYILRHELTHYKRHDVTKKLVAALAAAIFWWNPAVILLVRQLDDQIELACDEAVLEGDDEKSRLAYAETVYRVMVSGIRPSAIYTGLVLGDGRRASRRFAAMLKDGAGSKGRAAVAITVLLLLISSLAIGCHTTGDADGSQLKLFAAGKVTESAISALTPIPEADSQAGYRHVGWSIGEAGDAVPVFTPKSYEVRLVYNSDTPTAAISLPYGASLPTPVREGWSFGGWYSDAALTKRITSVSEDTTVLYAMWQGESEPSDFVYCEIDGGLSVVSYHGSGGIVRIPEYVLGRPVVAICDSAFRSSGITELIIPKNVTRVGHFAFASCSGLRSLTLWSSAGCLDESALSGCITLSEINVLGTSSDIIPDIYTEIVKVYEEAGK